MKFPKKYCISVIFLATGLKAFGANTPKPSPDETECGQSFSVSVSIGSLDIPEATKQILTGYPLTGETQIIRRPLLSDIEIDISVFMYENKPKTWTGCCAALGCAYDRWKTSSSSRL